jgi:hypothetical protein
VHGREGRGGRPSDLGLSFPLDLGMVCEPIGVISGRYIVIRWRKMRDRLEIERSTASTIRKEFLVYKERRIG